MKPALLFRFSLFAAAIAAMATSHPVKAAPGDKVGPEFRVAVSPLPLSGPEAFIPQIAHAADGDFVIAWVDDSYYFTAYDFEFTGGIFFQRYESDGTAKDSAPVLVTSHDKECPDGELPGSCGQLIKERPIIAMDDSGDFVVSWEGEYYGSFLSTQAYARRYSSSGVSLDAQPISMGNAGSLGRDIAMDADGDFVIASADYRNHFTDTSGPEFCRGTSVEGFTSTGQRRFSTRVSDENCSDRARVAIEPDGDFVVAFTARTYSCAYESECFTGSYAGARRYHSDGRPKDAADIKIGPVGGIDDVAVDAAGNFIVTGTGSSGVMMVAYRSNGQPKGPAMQVNAPGTGKHNESTIGIAEDGSFTVAWKRSTTNQTDSDIFWRNFGPDGRPVTPFHTRANSTTTDSQALPVTSVNADGSFVVAWRREIGRNSGFDTIGLATGIYAQRFAGNPTAPPPILPTVSFARAVQAVEESAGVVNVRVNLSAVSASPVTVPVRLGGTATRNADYRLPGTSVVIPAGARFANVPVTVINDRVREPRETLTLTMGTPVNANQGASRVFELAIRRSD
ncbi:MAG: Calx-beta domain-containing protein [Panacagrimonas sp.]